MNALEVFNGPVETGLRALVLLVEAYPENLDLHRLVTLDYFLVHSGDVTNGPKSLHPPSPLRAGEVATRRTMLEVGLRLYRTRGLIIHSLTNNGFSYVADEHAASFLDALTSQYVELLRQRARWVFTNLGSTTEEKLKVLLGDTLGRWRAESAILGLEEDE